VILERTTEVPKAQRHSEHHENSFLKTYGPGKYSVYGLYERQ